MADERDYLSPRRVAQALGISETTVKRWVDEGRLPAQRTAGGHRKVLVRDVLDLVSRENWPHRDLSLLTGPPAPPSLADAHDLCQRLQAALLGDDLGAARNVVLGAHQGGLSVARIADEMVSPAMARLGHGWSTGEIDVYQEHRGTQLCLAACRALRLRLPEATGEGAPLAVGGGPEGDHYILANLLIETSLVELGWRVMNIGPNTPFESFRLALRQLRPRMLWVSCSYLADPEAFLAGYGPLYEEAKALGVAVAVGGRALTEAVRDRMNFTHHGSKLAHLEAFANQLHAPRR